MEREYAWLRGAARDQSAVRGRVVRIEPYGAFIRFQWVTGLAHISQLASEFVRHPSDLLALGDEVAVALLDIDAVGRVSLALIDRSAGT